MTLITRKEYNAIYLLYPLYVFICYFQARGIIPPAYVPGNGAIMWPFRLVILAVGIHAFMLNAKKNKIVLSFFIACILSCFAYLYNNRPFILYFFDLAFYVLPMLFAFIGMDKNDVSNKFYKSVFWPWLICFIIGMYLYIVRPGWYQTALTNSYNMAWYRTASEDVTFDQIQETVRFSSFMLTSYATQYFCIYLVPMAFAFMSFAKGKIKLIYLISLIFLLVVILLSMQRSGIVGCFATVIAYIGYDLTHGLRHKKLYSIGIIISIIIVVIFISTDIGQKILFRFTEINLDDAFNDSRINQNESTLSVWKHYLFGEGIGAAGSEARRYGFLGISDGNYTKIIAEQGIVGIALIVLLLLSSFFHALKNFKYLHIECCIVGAMMVALVGSNAFTMSMLIPPFWFAIGRIWNKKYLYYLKEHKLHI